MRQALPRPSRAGRAGLLRDGIGAGHGPAISTFPAALRPRTLGRADLAVLGFCALGVGTLWTRFGSDNGLYPVNPPGFILGFMLLAAAGLLCLLAVGRPAALPGGIVCTVAIATQTLAEPEYLISRPQLYAAGLALAAVPLVRSLRGAWLLVGSVALASALAVARQWTWGHAPIDVFAEVQGSSQALLHGQNPYAGVYSVYLQSRGGHASFGFASLAYGPMVPILSVPARLLGDVRLTVVALNLAILAAVLVWAHRGSGSRRLAPTLTALWVASPFVPFMILMEWTDSFCVAGLAWWLVLRERHAWWAIVALSAGLASKPSILPLMVPLVLWSGAARRELLWSLVGALAIVAPFALWTGIPQFVYDTVGIYADLPARADAVNINGLAAVLNHGGVPGWVLLMGVAATLVVFVLRRFRDYGDLLVGGAGILTVICLFGKQSFLNYFFNAAIALLFVAGSGRMRPRDLAGRSWGVAALSRVVPGAGRSWPHAAHAALKEAPAGD